jgi:hypothetical protein
MAMVLLQRDPTMTREGIARILGCNPKTLMHRAKYPLLARAWARSRTQSGSITTPVRKAGDFNLTVGDRARCPTNAKTTMSS